MYLEEEYDDYVYLVSASDNYLVLTNKSYVNGDWQSPKTIPIIYKYLNPSFITVEDERTYTSYQEFSEIETSSSFYARADSLKIIEVQFILIFFIIFIFNGLTRFVKKGGVFFGN